MTADEIEQMLQAAAQDRRNTMDEIWRNATTLTGPRRDEVARILEMVAADGLPGPRDIDVALDAIEAALQAPDDD